MKKRLIVIIFLISSFMLTACGSSSTSSDNDGESVISEESQESEETSADEESADSEEDEENTVSMLADEYYEVDGEELHLQLGQKENGQLKAYATGNTKTLADACVMYMTIYNTFEDLGDSLDSFYVRVYCDDQYISCTATYESITLIVSTDEDGGIIFDWPDWFSNDTIEDMTEEEIAAITDGVSEAFDAFFEDLFDE